MFGLAPGNSDSVLKCLSNCHVRTGLYLFCGAPSGGEISAHHKERFCGGEGKSNLGKKRAHVTRGVLTNIEF